METMTAPKPWIGANIDRYQGAAMVTISRYWFEGDKLCSAQIEQWETASRGATSSARKAVKKLEGTM